MKRLVVGCCALLAVLAGCYGLGAGGAPQPLVTERDVLVGQQPEAAGYGMYSYLLLGSPPTPASRARYLAAIAAYLNYIPRRQEQEAYVPRSELNITYVFLTESPPALVSDIREGGLPADGDTAPAQWILEHYDYARARAVLRTVPGTHPDGPYIVSALQPLTGMPLASGGHLAQDLSHVPPDFAASWVKVFLAASADGMLDAPGGLQQAALTLRQTLAAAAESWPQIQRALEHWVTWTG